MTLEDELRMQDEHVVAEWLAHWANRDYDIWPRKTWGERQDRPLPIYPLRASAGTG